MQIALIASDPHVTLPTDLQIPAEFVGGISSKFGDTERIRNGSEEALVGPALVLTRGGRKRDQQGVCCVLEGRAARFHHAIVCILFACILIADRSVRSNVAFASALPDQRSEQPACV